MKTTTKTFTAEQITEMRDAQAAWKAGETSAAWPKWNARKRWELPNGKSYTNSGLARAAMVKAIG